MRRFFDFLALDLRSLAVGRILFGLVILSDLFWRAQSLFAHYTDGGVLPRDVLTDHYSQWLVSLHAASGSIIWEGALFIVAGVFAVMLILGYRTRLATIVSWVLLISLQNRNPLLLQGGDVLLRLGLFWAIFLPWGMRYSIDAIRSKTQIVQNRLLSIPSLIFMLQLALVYWCNVASKTDTAWHSAGNAGMLALMIDQFVTPFGKWLRQSPALVTLGTHAVLLLERFGSMLLFTPIFNGPIRTIIVLALIVMHFSFGAALTIGTFPWIMAAYLAALLPTWFWETIVGRIRSSIKRFNFFHHLEPEHREGERSLPFATLRVEMGEGTCAAHAMTRVRDVVLASLFVAGVVWAVSAVPNSKISFPSELTPLMFTLRLDQQWDMFAPYPMLDDGWFVIPGVLSSGTAVDLFRPGQPLSYEKPRNISAEYRDQYWRKYMGRLWEARYADYRLPYGQYLCRQWNAKHDGDEMLRSFEMIYIREVTQRDGTEAAPEAISIWKHSCFEYE